MSAAAEMPSPGTVLDGRYRLDRALGAGGMGTVYAGYHLRLRRPIAVKVLRPEYAKVPEFQIRFEREARASALLKSPHAVRVFDVGVSPEGFTYLVMEMLTGVDLASENARGPIPLPHLVDWTIQACCALQEAHDHGIVHRDIKPGNIFLAEEDGQRVAKLLDFGISKFDERLTAALTNPIDGALGTPRYMSPEQVRGHRVDGRTDIWSLGVVLYRILCQRWPFSGGNDAAYMGSILTDSPVPIESVRPDLPLELGSVIMRALEKKRDDRYASVSQLAAALAPFGTGKTVLPSLRTTVAEATQPTSLGPLETAIDPNDSTARISVPTNVIAPVPASSAAPVAGARGAGPARSEDSSRSVTPSVSEVKPPRRSRLAIGVAIALALVTSFGLGGYVALTAAPRLTGLSPQGRQDPPPPVEPREGPPPGLTATAPPPPSPSETVPSLAPSTAPSASASATAPSSTPPTTKRRPGGTASPSTGTSKTPKPDSSFVPDYL